MKNIFYMLLAFLSFQSVFTMNKEMEFFGQKVKDLNFHKTKDALWYEAHLEDNSLIHATFFLTGPAKNTYYCKQTTIIQPNNSPLQDCQNLLLPNSTFHELKNLYTQYQRK